MVSMRVCEIDGCEGPRKARGMCRKHYHAWYYAVGAANRKPRVAKSCRVDGCGVKATRRGMCDKHYRYGKRTGAMPDLSRCSVAGCASTHYGRGLCSRHYQNANYAENPERVREAVSRWRAENPEKAREISARYYAENRDAVLERDARYRAENREAVRERNARWRAENPEKAREISARRRARKAGATVEDFTRAEIFERDGWVCQLCDDLIDQGLSYPDPMSASLDHVIPLARGGEHSRANAQAAHLRCNVQKGARVAA